MMNKAYSELQKEITQRLQEITDNLKAAGYKEREIIKAIKNASQKVLIEISKENQRLKKEAAKRAEEN